jgi:hypothetical protein
VCVQETLQHQWRNYNGFRPGEPGGPNPNELNGGPQAQAVEKKHWPGRPLICYNVVFWPSEFCKLSPKSGKWHFRDSRFKNFPGEHALDPLKNSCIYGAQLVPLALLLGGPSNILNRGPPDITLRHCATLLVNRPKTVLFLKFNWTDIRIFCFIH